MERGQQIATLRRGLWEAFPESHPGQGGAAGGSRARGQSTGLPSLDHLLGNGLPVGRIAEVTGSSGSGRTALAFKVVAAMTRAGQPVAYIDLPGAFYPPSAEAAGVDLERLLLIRPQGVDEALKAADILLRGQAFPLVIFDWVNDSRQGSISTADLGSSVARLNGLCSVSESVLLFLTSPKTARDPLRYYASVRLALNRVEETSDRARLAHQASQAGAPSGDSNNEMRRLRLVGVPLSFQGERVAIQVAKHKLGPPGGRLEVAMNGCGTTRLPLHSGLPDTNTSA